MIRSASAVLRRLRLFSAAAPLLCLCVLAGSPAEAGSFIKVPLANGFDLPVGPPDGAGYYVFRGYFPNGHLGEDWNGNAGGDTDLGDPVYCTADGVVVFSEDYFRGWGNVVIVRHAYRGDDGRVALVDSLYGHLDKRAVRKYQLVKRGQQLGTIGTAHGKYAAHLHFEMRKNVQIGMARSSFARDYSNYFSPRVFISARRKLAAGASVNVPVDTFGAAGDSGEDPAAPSAGEAKKRDIPVPARGLIADTPAAGGDTDRADREARLRKLIEDNRKKVEALKDDDMDGFWGRLKGKLGNKK